MTLLRRQVTRWLLALGLAGSASFADVGQANAQFFEFLGQVFGSPARRYASPRSYHRPRHVPRGYVRIWVPDRAPRPRVARAPERVQPERVRRADVRAPRHSRFRLASLSNPPVGSKRHWAAPLAGRAGVRPGAGIKPGARPPIGDPVAALLNDPTLRRGDIVVLPGGPRIFKGGRTAPHRPADFEDVRRTRLVGDRLRRQLTAMPVQAPVRRIETETAAKPPEKPDGTAAKEAPLDVTVTGTVPRHDQP